MRIQVVSGCTVVHTTLERLFEALRSVARSEAEAEAVLACMVSEGRVRALPLPRAA